MLRMLSSYLHAIKGSKNLLFLLLLSFAAPQANAQVKITIGGNVYGGGEAGKVTENGNVTIKSGTFTGNIYGGGNLGDLDGQTAVTLQGGDIQGHVFGGARMANIGKFTYVNVDGANQLHDLTVNHVYGGNDISGHVGDNLNGTVGATTGLPFTPEANNGTVYVDNTFQSFIHTTKEKETGDSSVDTLNIFIGQMFNGGNGDYTYGTELNTDGKYEVKSSDGTTVIATSATAFTAPEVAKSYMQVNGGTYGYIYAGGNAATVTEAAVISINDTSTISTGTYHLDLTQMTTLEAMMTNPSSVNLNNSVDLRLLAMGINLSTFHTGHHFNRVFGGNNKADMAIMPHWNLVKGSTHDLYSGGNEGRMTYHKGILLEIKEGSEISAVNVYGGCRKADVHPLTSDGKTPDAEVIQLTGYNFPQGFSARTLVRGGKIQNVYGGNDISGDVYGGNAVGIYHSITGDVYGGGNGSYAYTDNADLKDDLIWGDYYYNPGSSSIDSLNAHRPNAEQVSLRLYSSSASNPTVIGGGVYVGGNSATLSVTESNPNPRAELKIGSNVVADKVFLGNNGENMVDSTSTGVLKRYAGNVTDASQTTRDFSSLDLTDATIFAKYMDGCAMRLYPRVVFDGDASTDPATYIDNSTFFGSFYCGGNVGSMITSGMTTINFDRKVIIYNKLVGGCNNANVAATDYNAAYKGGLLGTEAEQASYVDGSGNIKDRLTLNLGAEKNGVKSGVKIAPSRWILNAASVSVGDDVNGLYTQDSEGNILAADGMAVSGTTYYSYGGMEYNVFDKDGNKFTKTQAAALSAGTSTADDEGRRVVGGNVYGGCYNSGHVNGNVIINLNHSIHDRDHIFDEVSLDSDGNPATDTDGHYTISTRHTGVILHEQGMDVLGSALNVFGAGYGEASEIWGSTTVNLNAGYTFQIFGGGEHGPIGKTADDGSLTYNEAYSATVNLKGEYAGVAYGATGDHEYMAESEFIYGGGFEGSIAGNTIVNLGNGRIFNSFGGSCNADIYGHTETYMGRNTSDDSDEGFPWVREHIYGGNDLGGRILNTAPSDDDRNPVNPAEFTARINSSSLPSVYQYDGSTVPEVTKASAYVEYKQGRVDYIFGGNYGDYDYTDPTYDTYFYTTGGTGTTTENIGTARDGYYTPYLKNAFVNFRTDTENAKNQVLRVYGGGQGHKDEHGMNLMQDRSYVLVDIPQSIQTFLNTEIFGAGAFGGVGMGVTKTLADTNANGVEGSAVIDLVRGQISAVYGGSYQQGITRRTIVNVPTASTLVTNNIFAGAYGTDGNASACDVYEGFLNYAGASARVNGALYGGNNNYRRTLYGKVNISAPVKKSNGTDGYAYGAGKGANTWSEYTEVNLLSGGSVYEVYGGGDAGKVLNLKSITAKAATEGWNIELSGGYTDIGLASAMANVSALYTDTGNTLSTDDTDGNDGQGKYNTNVHIYEGGTVNNYAYGGGYGADATVSGTTYIDLLGGYVNKDMYAGGTRGSVEDLYKLTTFTASANAYVKGGGARNVYGGGWEGDVGYHDKTTTETTNDVLGTTHVYIGNLTGSTFLDGVPVVRRSAYGGGESGAVFGTTNITLYNGYIGYKYENDAYVENLNDRTADDGVGLNKLIQAGNIFGSGYADYSNADFTNVTLYGGIVRNSVYGGGEIGTVGRGLSDGTVNFGGETHVKMYKGHVKQDVFGGGRGYDNLNRVSAIGTSGYVFGSTDVGIYGGEVGTEAGVADGYGNVFGGGNIGFVYSALGTKGSDGYYYDSSSLLTEDCRVVVAPACQVLDGCEITLNGTTYTAGEYVPAENLNYLKNKNSDSENWAKLDATGVTIRNAVFAGGNVSAGSDQVYANTVTVYGNATATLYDIFNRDLITIGTEHVGGLYGDGNLTLVDGYRELNVSNYGTDYYGMSDNISLEDYYKLTDRERAYFELKYKCTSNYTSAYLNRDVSAGEQLASDEYEKMIAAYPDEATKWVEAGFCSIYAGRLLNTLQRADFAGLFGSRMVLQGAQDRVPEVVDYTNYTINRVAEVSLNKSKSQAGDTGDGATHGCYFGIYNIVNALGALTSDVDFQTTERTTDNTESLYTPDNAGQTFYQWKQAHNTERKRNNGNCAHKVALASGVYLEITTEESTKDNKVWGPITGVCQLDLISVNTGLGGGYVYAKNIHGKRSLSGNDHTILSEYNKAGYGHEKAVTHKIYTYTTDTDLEPIETSGNFIHNLKQIIDDCFPVSDSYSGANASAAHYWYIRGQIYVYDQYVSAYTGSASAYSESINLPLTITPASNGVLQLQNVKPNLYAYYDLNGDKLGTTNNYQLIGTTNYYLNDPITYWDWSLLTSEQQACFVAETYITSDDCTLADGTTTVAAGTVYLPSEYEALKDDNPTVTCPALDKNNPVDFDEVFHMTNHISHTTGYALTYDVNNPAVWNRYYSPITGDSNAGKLSTADYEGSSSQSSYLGAPTYTPSANGVYGQHDYAVGDIIPDAIHTTYEAITDKSSLTDQATVVEAYVATGEVVYTIGTEEHHVYKGSTISATDYASLTSEQKAKFATANVCSSTIELGNNEFIFYGDLLTDDEITTKKATYVTYLVSTGLSNADATTKADADFAAALSKAWYCSVAGKYGGDYYEASKNYRALDAWCSMSETDRQSFTFNYDAFDVLVDPTYSGPQNYDGYYPNSTDRLYSAATYVDYEATYNGTENLTYTDESGSNTVTITPSQVITRDEYMEIPNEKRYYQSLNVTTTGNNYIVKVPFTRGDIPYTVGTLISSEIFNALDDTQKQNVVTQNFTTAGTYYFCRKAYTINEHGEGVAVLDIAGTTHSQDVQIGTIITETVFNTLPNKQVNFTIKGTIPVETSTLYVSRESNIKDLNEDKIITVIYKYVYEESDESGNHTEEITEQHVVNIHLQFKSGVPTIGELEKPNVVLPHSTIGLKQPNVTPGAFEIIGGGWEMFTNQTDAEQHTNGQPYYNNLTKLYWYQNDYYVAYYAKSYLGKTYSNAVQFKVANYHDLDAVMQDTEHHLYVDHEHAHRTRDPKIYIDDRECTDNTKSEIDLLKDFFDVSLNNTMDQDGNPTAISGTGTAADGHKTVDARIKGLANLDFIMRSDVATKKNTWTPIGTSGQCFEGTFHGDGFTITGLDHSLFGYLCGIVYNLGVRGSFTSAGVADTGSGFVQNCWTYSTATTMDAGIQGVFGNPSRTSTDSQTFGSIQIANCYYPESNPYPVTTNSDNHGVAIKKPVEAFYNGEVTYDLNGFYLFKRYNDNATGLTYDATKTYGYLDADVLDGDGKMTVHQDGQYVSHSYFTQPYDQGYLEDWYSNVDFIYAGGTIPEGEDERYVSSTGKYYPIWPDDYLFFGQMLTYDYVDGRPHEDYPSFVNKNNGRLLSAGGSNRVYRAPAYFQSKEMSVAHFNPDAVFAQTKKNNSSIVAYKGMTAIDFTGYNDAFNSNGAKNYQLDRVTTEPYNTANFPEGAFCPPLLDDDGLTSFTNVDLTKNLLTYIPQATGTATDAASKTYTVVTNYMADPTYAETSTTYRTVAASTATLHGHRVVQDATNSTSYTAPVDHFLVDKNDFNAPMSYTFAEGKRMWYQRVPDSYVDLTKGWEGISIPFSPELVTTQTKGELTHFYEGSTAGHEYWLREFAAGGAADALNPTTIYVANFTYPAAGSGAKSYTNTFLWDYYYSKNPETGKTAGQDANTDEYQYQDNARKYYSEARSYANYPYATAAKPYIIGFPGSTYYEFDLSGSFKPENTILDIDRIAKQTITFASEPGISIAVSDTELKSGKVTADGYVFTPNYLSKSVDAGAYMLTTSSKSKTMYTPVAVATTLTAGNTYYTSSTGGGEFTADGTEVATGSNYYVLAPTTNSTYKLTSAATAGVPFRPYFTASGSGVKGVTDITFSDISSTFGDDDEEQDGRNNGDKGELDVRGKRGRIIVKSKYNSNTVVHIVNAAGALVRTFDIAPGQTIETNVAAGVYIVNKKKISIR